MANNTKFLQILRNFGAADRQTAENNLKAVANGNLYKQGTPVVAFYGQNKNPKGETRDFPVRTQNGGYGTDTTLTYQALLGIMGQNKGEIEIFDIESSVDAILGGATEVTVSQSGTHGAGTWNFRSLGGIQVVIEEMDQVIAASLTDLKNRITNITGEATDDYVADQTTNYLQQASDLKDADRKLDAEIKRISDSVSANRIVNQDQSITVTPPAAGGSDTTVSVHIKTGEQILSNDSTAGAGGLQTTLTLHKLTSEEVTELSDVNVREAYKLLGKSNAQIGDTIKIYKDSSLKEVYLGANTDTIDAATGTITKNPVTDPQSMNFAYQLADGTYSLTKIDVSKFLTESEFGDGLTVADAVVKVNAGEGLGFDTSDPKKVVAKIDPSTEKVYTAYDGTGTGTTQSDVFTVSDNGLKVANIQAAIDAKIGTLDVTDTAVAGQYVSAVNETDGKVAMTRANVSEAVLNNYTKSASAPDSTAVAATDTINTAISKLEWALDNAVADLDGTALASEATNLDTTPTGDFKVLTSVVEVDGKIKPTTEANGSKAVVLKEVAATGAAADLSYDDTQSRMGTEENPITTVQSAIEKLDNRIDTLGTDALESVTSGNGGIVVGAKSNHTQEITLTLDDSTANTVQTGTGENNALSITTDGLFLSNVWDCGTYDVSIDGPTQNP